MNNEDHIKYIDTSKQVIEIWSGGNENPEGSVPLDEKSLPYIRIKLK